MSGSNLISKVSIFSKEVLSLFKKANKSYHCGIPVYTALEGSQEQARDLLPRDLVSYKDLDEQGLIPLGTRPSAYYRKGEEQIECFSRRDILSIEKIQVYSNKFDIPWYLVPYKKLEAQKLIPTSQPFAYLQTEKYAIPLYDVRTAVDHSYFQHAISARELELNLLWQRSIFFVGFVAAATAAVPELLNSSESDLLLPWLMALGTISSIGWLMINLASKYWVENWEIKVFQNPEIKRLFQPLSLQKKTWFARRISVSKLTTFFSFLVSLLWASGFGYSLRKICLPWCKVILVTIILYLISSAILWYFSRPED